MKYVLDILMDFDLCEKLFYITTNNAFNIDTIIKHLFDSILDKTSVPYDMKNQHISCFGHVINLMISVFLKNLKDLADNRDKWNNDVM